MLLDFFVLTAFKKKKTLCLVSSETSNLVRAYSQLN